MNAMAAAKKTNLNDLTLNEKKALIKETYQSTSYFQHLFNSDFHEIDCQQSALALRHQIERLLIAKNLIPREMPLENLHESLPAEMKAYNFNDGVNKISTHFYETDGEFLNIYYQFIKFLRENFLAEPFWFQSTPTIRIHCPNAENSHHYPRYHSDISYGHPPEEINIWFPLTDVLEGHSFRAMSVDASRKIIAGFDHDFAAMIHSAIHDKAFTAICDAASKAINTPFGRLVAFDSRCIHTGEPMKGHTRISMDIRILPKSQESTHIEYQGSGRRRILFAPGHCYHEHDSDYFLNGKGI